MQTKQQKNLISQINRHYQRRGEHLRVRMSTSREVSNNLGEYHIVDISRNTVVDTHVDLLDKATEVKRERIEAETVNLN
jgi:hypothetical protein